VLCTYSPIRSLNSNPVNPHPYNFVSEPPSSLQIFTACHDPGTEVSFIDTGSAGATLNWVYSINGSTSVVANGNVMAGGGGTLNFPFTNRIEGQFIYSDGNYVATVNVHGFDGGVDACEFRGTIETAPVEH
jgi:hypothetical protein